MPEAQIRPISFHFWIAQSISAIFRQESISKNIGVHFPLLSWLLDSSRGIDILQIMGPDLVFLKFSHSPLSKDITLSFSMGFGQSPFLASSSARTQSESLLSLWENDDRCVRVLGIRDRLLGASGLVGRIVDISNRDNEWTVTVAIDCVDCRVTAYYRE